MKYFLRCVFCQKKYSGSEIRYRCDCGEILEVKRTDWDGLKRNLNKKIFDERLSTREFPYRSGVWRYQELLPHIVSKHIVTKPEGNTNLYNVLYFYQKGKFPPQNWPNQLRMEE